MKLFIWPIFLTLLTMIAAYLWGGLTALTLMFSLSVLEISLSCDNAIVNAKILKDMDQKWRKRFLTWGILIAVFGVRFLLPLLIVSIITGLHLFETLVIAIRQPEIYAMHLHSAHHALSAFGGIFLLMVFLNFIFDHSREIHWFTIIERNLTRIGKFPFIDIIAGLMIVFSIHYFSDPEYKFTVTIAGLLGMLLFVLLHSSIDFLKKRKSLAKGSQFISFLYLEALDASFSFDGVMGAFAITKDIVIILLGLTLGAFFVRTITIFLVRKKTLQKYVYLEHGAHYAIGALAVIMLLTLRFPIPEMLTGFIGVLFIFLSLLSSIYYNKKMNQF